MARRKTTKNQVPAKSEPPRGNSRMAPRLNSDDPKNVSVVIEDEYQLRDLLGTKTPNMANGIFLSAMNALGVNGALYREMMAIMGEEMEPSDAVEAMLYSQQVATHVALMTLSGKVMDATARNCAKAMRGP